METAVDDGKAVVVGLVDLPVGEARAEALGIVEPVEIHLRLGMMMGRIGGPLAGEVQHLAQDHVGEGRVLIVEEGLDLPAHGAHKLPVGPGVLDLDRFGGVEHGRVVPVVGGLLNVQLRVGSGGQGDLRPPRGQQAVGLVAEAVGAVGQNGRIPVAQRHSALEQQHGGLLFPVADGVGVARFHHQHAHVHLGPQIVRRGVDIHVVAAMQLFVEIHMTS